MVLLSVKDRDPLLVMTDSHYSCSLCLGRAWSVDVSA